MRGIFEDEEAAPEENRRDTELTLGSGMLLSLFFGLVLICGLCFGLGYAMGRHSVPLPPDSLSHAMPASQLPLEPNASLSKPAAAPPAAVISPVETAGAALGAAGFQGTSTLAMAQKPARPAQPAQTVQTVQHLTAQSQAPAAQSPVSAVKTSASPGASPDQPPDQPLGQQMVRPALAPPAALPQSAPASTVEAALPPASSFMVQIAAVASLEDAQVLMTALRQRGYAVSVRRNLIDNLLHVRIGPYATRAVADQWRLKLLNDGYNAVIQP